MLAFGAYSESLQYGLLILLIQAAIHSPKLGGDDSLTNQTFVPPPIVSVTTQTSIVPSGGSRLEKPNARYSSPTSRRDCRNIHHLPTLKIVD